MKKVAVVMGSISDYDTVKKCIDTLKEFGAEYEAKVISAHRTPALAAEFAAGAKQNGIGVIIAAAGKAAHLGGVLAAYTTLPVIGLPIKSSLMDGVDSLLSMVQMPSGVPVACVAVNGAENAALLAVQMLALSDEALALRLEEHKEKMRASVEAAQEKLEQMTAEQYKRPCTGPGRGNRRQSGRNNKAKRISAIIGIVKGGNKNGDKLQGCRSGCGKRL